MTDFISNLLNQLEDQVKFIDLEQDDPIKGAQLSIDNGKADIKDIAAQ